MSVFVDAGLLILGTRMKRLSERFLSEISKVYKEQGVLFEPAWFPIFYMLDKKGTLSLTELANDLEVSHSAISQMITQLQERKLVVIVQNEFDARVKQINFTHKGKKLINQVHSIWQVLIQTLDQILSKEEQVQFLHSLAKIEENITSGYLANHSIQILSASPIEIKCFKANKMYVEKLVKWAKGEGLKLVPGKDQFQLAISNNEIVGYLAYSFDKENILIENLFIAPSYRRQGIGSKLIESINDSFLVKTRGYFSLSSPTLEIVKLLLKLNYSFKVK